MADWEKIRIEYIAGASQNSLCKRYKVSPNSVTRQRMLGEWDKARENARKEKAKMAAEKAKTEEAMLHEYGTILMGKPIEGMQATTADNWQALKAYAQIGRDIRQILDIKSDKDLQEQDARIAELRKRAELDKEGGIKLEVVGLPEEFKR